MDVKNAPFAAVLAAMADRGEEGPVAPALSTALSDSDAEVRATALNLMEPPGNTVGGS